MSENLDVAFNRFYADIARYAQQLREGAPSNADYIWKEFDVNVRRFSQVIHSFQASLVEVEEGLQQKRSELAVAASDLKMAQDKHDDLTKRLKQERAGGLK